jgi:metal-dependent amidase/aminoacylase/carboxypeptidase family protein
MPVLNRIASYADEMKGWRRYLHQHPELAFDCHETAAWIVSGCARSGWTKSIEGIAKTGIVALIKGRGRGR